MTSLGCTGTVYEADDEEADKIYEAVDAKMEERRRIKRKAREQEEMDQFRKERPTIQLEFADLKRGLTAVSDDEWQNLPEVGNLTGKRRKTHGRDNDRAYVVPDSILVSARDANSIATSLDSRQMANGGFETPAASGSLTDLVEIGQARNSSA